MEVDAHRVLVRGEEVQLPLKEFHLLEYLMRNAGRVLARGQLIDRVWGTDYYGDTETLDVHIKRLRSKVELDPAVPTRVATARQVRKRFTVRSVYKDMHCGHGAASASSRILAISISTCFQLELMGPWLQVLALSGCYES